MNLAFNNLSCSIRPKLFSQEKKNVLSNVCGDFRPGELTGIMVSSDTGSSFLMDILAGFTTSGVTGVIQIDGCMRNLSKFRYSSVYITQENHLQLKLTVEETMHIAANLKLQMTSFEKLQVINIILKELKLKAFRKIYTKDLSSSQKKQLTIALELLTNPPVIFIEKPTSDLDNIAAAQIITLLKSLAREGRTIVCTIEQPSAKILKSFDHLYVIGHSYCVYAGSPRNLVPYLQNLNLHCPLYHNPADYLLELMSDEDHVTKFIALSENGKCEKWRFARNTDQNNEFARIEIASRLSFINNAVNCIDLCCFYNLKHIRTLVEYNLIKLSRDKVLTYLRLSVNFLMALIIGILYYGIGQDPINIFINFKMLFFILSFLVFTSFYTTLITFPSELPILKREHSNNWYSLHSFYLANRLADLPVQVTATSVYVLIIYFMTGQLLEFQRIRLFLITCVLVSLVGQSLGVIMSINFRSQIATTIGPLLIISSILFSGFFVQLHHANYYLQWIFKLSFCKYGYEEIIATIFGSNWPLINNNDFSQELHVPNNIANEFGVEQLDYWYSASILIGFYVILNFVAYISLLIYVRRR